MLAASAPATCMNGGRSVSFTVADTSSNSGSSAVGSSGDHPTDPNTLTAEQASKAMTLFFRPTVGYFDATFSVRYTGPALGAFDPMRPEDAAICNSIPGRIDAKATLDLWCYGI